MRVRRRLRAAPRRWRGAKVNCLNQYPVMKRRSSRATGRKKRLKIRRRRILLMNSQGSAAADVRRGGPTRGWFYGRSRRPWTTEQGDEGAEQSLAGGPRPVAGCAGREPGENVSDSA